MTALQSTKMSLKYYSQHSKPNTQKVKMTSLAQSVHVLHAGGPILNLSQITVQYLFEDYIVTTESKTIIYLLHVLCTENWRGEKEDIHS